MNKKIIITLVLLAGMVLPSASMLIAQTTPRAPAQAQGSSNDTVPNGCTIEDSSLLTSFTTKGLKCIKDCQITGSATNLDCGLCCFVVTINKITDWIFYIMTVIAILLFVYGGIVFMTSMGNPDGATKGKNILIYAIIGLIVALLAKVFPSIVVSIVA